MDSWLVFLGWLGVVGLGMVFWLHWYLDLVLVLGNSVDLLAWAVWAFGFGEMDNGFH